MIDFTGWACVNCRKMEENVWPDVEVLKRLSEKYVIVSLYVDDKKNCLKTKSTSVKFFKGRKSKRLEINSARCRQNILVQTHNRIMCSFLPMKNY